MVAESLWKALLRIVGVRRQDAHEAELPPGDDEPTEREKSGTVVKSSELPDDNYPLW